MTTIVVRGGVRVEVTEDVGWIHGTSCWFGLVFIGKLDMSQMSLENLTVDVFV